MLSYEVYNINSCIYSCVHDVFFNLDNQHNRTNCREIGAAKLLRADICYGWNNNFFMKTPDHVIRDGIVYFVNHIEDRLGWQHTNFQITNYSNHLIVRPSPEWRKRNMRAGFFTLLLRAAGHHRYGMPDEQTFQMDNYLRLCTRATERFLSGHTWYRNNFHGVHFYTNLNDIIFTQDHINYNLIHPRVIEENAYYRWERAGRPQNCGDKFWNEAVVHYS